MSQDYFGCSILSSVNERGVARFVAYGPSKVNELDVIVLLFGGVILSFHEENVLRLQVCVGVAERVYEVQSQEAILHDLLDALEVEMDSLFFEVLIQGESEVFENDAVGIVLVEGLEGVNYVLRSRVVNVFVELLQDSELCLRIALMFYNNFHGHKMVRVAIVNSNYSPECAVLDLGNVHVARVEDLLGMEIVVLFFVLPFLLFLVPGPSKVHNIKLN